MEPAQGAYASALMLVPYQDRIDKFFKAHGDMAYDRMKDPTYEMEVSTFYRVTVDMRRVNAKTGSRQTHSSNQTARTANP